MLEGERVSTATLQYAGGRTSVDCNAAVCRAVLNVDCTCPAAADQGCAGPEAGLQAGALAFGAVALGALQQGR
eukprot:10175-Chlamydomonas_euryale.AAC.1